MLNVTKHAETRCQQRGFSKDIVQIIMDHGRFKPAPGGAHKLFFGNKEYSKAINELKKKIKVLEKARGSVLVLGENEIITVYNLG